MSDLIRREDVIKLVNQFVFGLCKEQNDEARRTFNKYIEKMPTAYDIDKAIKELQENIDLPFGIIISDETSRMAIQALEKLEKIKEIITNTNQPGKEDVEVEAQAFYEIDRNADGEKLVAVKIEGKWHQVKYSGKGVMKNE